MSMKLRKHNAADVGDYSADDVARCRMPSAKDVKGLLRPDRTGSCTSCRDSQVILIDFYYDRLCQQYEKNADSYQFKRLVSPMSCFPTSKGPLRPFRPFRP